MTAYEIERLPTKPVSETREEIDNAGCDHRHSVTQVNGEGAYCRDCGETLA